MFCFSFFLKKRWFLLDYVELQCLIGVEQFFIFLHTNVKSRSDGFWDLETLAFLRQKSTSFNECARFWANCVAVIQRTWNHNVIKTHTERDSHRKRNQKFKYDNTDQSQSSESSINLHLARFFMSISWWKMIFFLFFHLF